MEYLKVKEWKEKSGLNLFNYDGFTNDYESLVQERNNSFSEHINNRFNSAGDLICSRKYFESKLYMCTIKMSPSKEDFVAMADVIPDFVEHLQDGFLMGELLFLKKKIKEYKKEPIFKRIKKIGLDNETIESIHKLYEKILLKNVARKKSIFYAGINDNSAIVKLEKDDIQLDKYKSLKKYLNFSEMDIYQMLDDKLQKIINEPNKYKITDLPIDLIDAYNILSYKRRKLVSKQSKEEMGELYLIPIANENKDFSKTFSIISPEGIDHRVAFSFTDANNNTVKGIMPISEETKEKIDNNGIKK